MPSSYAGCKDGETCYDDMGCNNDGDCYNNQNSNGDDGGPDSDDITAAFSTSISTEVPNITSPSSGEMIKTYTTTSTAPPTGTTHYISGVYTSVSGATGSLRDTTSPPHRPVILTVVLPLLSVVFVLLMLICFILIWKKTFKRKKSKQDSLKLQNNEMKQELGEAKGKFKDPYPIEQSVTSLNLYTDSKSDGYKKVLATKDSANGEAQYAEVEECIQPVKDGTQENHGYEEAIVGGTQRNDGYEEAKVESTRNGQGYEKAKDKGTQDRDGYETAKVSGPFCHTLDPDDPSDSSYMSVSKNKQDGGYDTLDRQQNPSQPKSQTTSGYDLTERIGKDGAKVEPSNQIDNDYLAVSRSSANTSEYDKLDRTRRNYEVGGISPNEYNVLQPQEKE